MTARLPEPRLRWVSVVKGFGVTGPRLHTLRRFRRLNRAWAFVRGYYWLSCPICGRMYGGHECAEHVFVKTENPRTSRMVCWRHEHPAMKTTA